MTIGATTVEQLCNEALDRIGYPESIGFIYEGTKQARIALRLYGQTRDDLLREQDWGFAERNVALTLLKTAPTGGYFPPTTWNGTSYPPIPWIYEYQYNSDMIKVRSIKPAPLIIPDFDPQPVTFRIENDNYFSTPKKVILCNVQNAICTYTGQITDMTTWEPSFTEAFITRLSERMLVSLGDPRLLQAESQKAAGDEMMAAREQG